MQKRSRVSGSGMKYVILEKAQKIFVPASGTRRAYYRYDPRNKSEEEKENIFWHGSPSGELVGGTTGLHVGTFEAAREALEARIGVPAQGDWDGTREYGKTLLAGKKTLERMHKEIGGYYDTGYNAGSSTEEVPEEDYYPSQRKYRAKYSGGAEVSFDSKPTLIPIRIKGKMSNEHKELMEDTRANSTMASMMKRGKAKSGYYYRNIGEDESSVSAVVPNKEWVEMVKGIKYVILEKGKEVYVPAGTKHKSYWRFDPREKRHELELSPGDEHLVHAMSGMKETYPNLSLRDFAIYNERAKDVVAHASTDLLKEQVAYNKAFAGIRSDHGLLERAYEKVKAVVKDKVDIKKQYKELKELGKKHGPYFLAYAIGVEVMEDIILPAFFTAIGKPGVGAFLLVWHSEWFMYPLYFAIEKYLKKKGWTKAEIDEFMDLMKASYPGNLGFVELYRFYAGATDEAIHRYERFLKLGNTKSAVAELENFAGYKLHPSVWQRLRGGNVEMVHRHMA